MDQELGVLIDFLLELTMAGQFCCFLNCRAILMVKLQNIVRPFLLSCGSCALGQLELDGVISLVYL